MTPRRLPTLKPPTLRRLVDFFVGVAMGLLTATSFLIVIALAMLLFIAQVLTTAAPESNMPTILDTTAPSTASGDLFAGTAAARPMLTLQGKLVRDAEVRAKPLASNGVPVPVLCLDMEVCGSGGNTIHAEQPYTEATRHIAKANAAQLKAGMVITVQHETELMRLVLPHVRQIEFQEV